MREVKPGLYVSDETESIFAPQQVTPMEDLRLILRALGCFDGAMPISPHEVVLTKVIPAIEALKSQRHWCSGCGHRWKGPLKGVELCGYCWRTAQPVVHRKPVFPENREIREGERVCPTCGSGKASHRNGHRCHPMPRTRFRVALDRMVRQWWTK